MTKLIIKAAVLTNVNTKLKLMNLEVPKLLFGQVLVKIFYSGVCRSQLMEIEHKRGYDKWLPHLLGHEASGEVVEIGDGVTKVKKGDYVILTWIKGSGIDSPGAQYLHEGYIINSGPISTFSNYSIVSENRIIIKPKKIELNQAVLYGCAIPTGAGMVIKQIKPMLHEFVLIIGLGGIGLSALLALISKKHKKIIVIDNSSVKLDLAEKFGVKFRFKPDMPHLIKAVIDITKGGADICIESAGLTSTIEQGFSLINKFSGKLYFASHPPNNEYIKIYPHDLICGKKIFGTWGGDVKPDSDIKKISKLFLSSKINLDLLIPKIYELESINTAFEDMKNGSVLRPIIKMNH